MDEKPANKQPRPGKAQRPDRFQGEAPPESGALADLEARSMLARARAAARAYGGTSRMWLQPHAQARPRMAAAMAPVWITTYPAATITPEGSSVLATLGDERLWQALSRIGIRAIHIGPTKRAGGLERGRFTPTVDGHFDRIGFDIDPDFGTDQEFVALSTMAAAHNAVVIDDVVPAHTGRGPDFHLACMRYKDYAGLYHMVEIPPEDWGLLPEVAPGRDSVNLPPEAVELLAARGYIVGPLQRVIFFEPGVKETDWSATPAVRGCDGIERRWVYLHYFKEGQPALNWLDPSFAAEQMVVGDALHSLDRMGARGLRLDANGFLGIERREDGTVWSEGHPLALVANNLLAGMIRKAGGFSFQELNLTVDDIKAMSGSGADLSYDFITRPAYHHALASGDTAFLRMMLRLVHEYGIDPGSLVHALQNHDELTLELVHFWTLHGSDMFTLGEHTWQGRTLRNHIREFMYATLSGADTPYNLRFVTNGIAGTTASLIAAALGFGSISALDETRVETIRRAHLLLAMYNALQPGVFALSAWDLVGALPLDPEEVEPLLADGDTRWILRGAYDLTGAVPGATRSAAGLPRARALYGPITAQLDDPDSFVSRLRKLLAVRDTYGLAVSQQIEIPDVDSAGLLVMVHELPDQGGIQITALNFGREPVEEVVRLGAPHAGPVFDMIAETVEQTIEDGLLPLRLAPLAGCSLRIAPPLPVL
ncbi:maltose alpha-D-glucosyltransferase [Pontibaca methylaminivorans]|uniref:Trehalose synthase n=1 Tax=Pontibaca methylaminivorans TaxID=515897 RepID=A0A1R3X734_9RHOB|nr:maltose alpha-D-glucosyltransferase [Pontibaca methylaminivorans]SIT86715.1 trehalose synthase [Pontibaca methylaminivorans]